VLYHNAGFIENPLFLALLSGGIRFYGYIIMALSYLTSLDPPVIPNLQHINPQSIDDDCNIETCSAQRQYWDTVLYQNRQVGIATRFHDCVAYDPSQSYCKSRPLYDEQKSRFYWRSSNSSNVGELFIDFMYHYGYEFDYDRYAISLKTGGRTHRKDFAKGDVVVIEDPFIPSINIA
jgi:DNA polymerase sigma